MSTRNADVNLIVRAKTEGEKAISSMADALAHLTGDAVSGSGKLAEFGKVLGGLDKVAAGLAAAQEKVGASATRQAAAVHTASAGIAEQKARIADLQRGVQILAAEQDKAFVGPRRNGLSDLLKVAKGELRDAEGQLSRFTASFDRNLAALQTSRSGLLDLKRTTSEVSQAQRTAQGSLAATTAEIEKQQRAARALNDINRTQPAPSGKSAEDSASVFARSGRSELERSLDAADKLRAEEAAVALTAAERARQEATAAAELERQERAARSINAIRRTQPGLTGKSAEESAAVFARGGATTVERDLDAADRLRAKLNPLAAIQSAFNAELTRYRDLAAKGRISTDELAAAEAHLKREMDDATAAAKRAGNNSGAFRSALFGLEPYQLQNLSYQVNDVFTQLASGTSLTRTLGQQGGQILQIFPRISSAIFSAFTNPAFLGAAAVAGTIAIALNRAADQAERLRNATADLGRRTNGGDYKAFDIAEQQRQLQRLGASAGDARSALGTFIDAGVPAQSLAQFGRIAKELAGILGTELPDAAKQVATAFTGSYQAIAELDNRLNFLTGTQREHIRQLFEEGRAREAQTQALNIFTGKMDAAATQARGPWASANRELKKSWDNLLESFANSKPIQETSGLINVLAGAVKGLAFALDDMSAGGDLTELAADLAEIAALRKALATPGYANDNYGIGSDTSPDKLRERLAVRIKNYNDAAQRQNRPLLDASGNQVASNAAASGAGRATTQGDTPLARQRRDRIVAINDEDELQKLRDAGSQRLLTAAERTRRTQLAGAVAFRQEQDAAVGAIRRQNAEAHEGVAIQKESKAAEDRRRAEARQAQQERNQTIQRYLQRIGAAEGGARPNRAGSSALGIGQFTRGTFIDTYRRANPGTQFGDDQIADLRRNPAVAQQILDIFTRQNAHFLTRLGQTISGANLYLIHFLGQGTGGAALRAPGSTPIDQIIRRNDPNAETVLRQNRGYLFDKDKGRYRTRAELQTFLGNRVGDAAGIGGEDRGASVVEVQANEARIIEAARKKQEELNQAIRHGNEDRQRGIDAQRAQDGKFGTGLIDVQRAQAGANAADELRQRVEDINRAREEGAPLVTVTDQQIADVRRLAEALFDVQHARDRIAAQRDDAQRPVDELQQQKALLQQQAEFLRSIGDNDGAEKVESQIRSIGGAIGQAYDALIAFYQALTPQQRVDLGILDQAQLDALIAKLGQAKDASQEWGRVAGLPGQEIARAFAGAAVNAFTNFINKVAAGKNVFKSLADGIREFAASFIQSIAQMILQLLAYAAAVSILRALGVPVPGSIGVGQNHTGGIAGGSAGGVRRNVSPAIFAGAMRYHTGGIVGLAADEQPAILRKGEEVLTESDPRHRFNGGAAANDRAASPAPVNIINTFDREEAAEMLLRTRAGERALINIISDNKSAVKAALG